MAESGGQVPESRVPPAPISEEQHREPRFRRGEFYEPHPPPKLRASPSARQNQSHPMAVVVRHGCLSAKRRSLPRTRPSAPQGRASGNSAPGASQLRSGRSTCRGGGRLPARRTIWPRHRAARPRRARQDAAASTPRGRAAGSHPPRPPGGRPLPVREWSPRRTHPERPVKAEKMKCIRATFNDPGARTLSSHTPRVGPLLDGSGVKKKFLTQKQPGE